MAATRDELAARIRAAMPSVQTVPNQAEPEVPVSAPPRDRPVSFHIRLPETVLDHLTRIAWTRSAEQGRKISPQTMVQELIAREFGLPIKKAR